MNRTRFPVEVDQDPPFQAVPVWTKAATSPENAPESILTKPNRMGVFVFDDKNHCFCQ